MDFETLHDRVTSILAEGLTPDAVADAICAAVGLEKPAPPESPPLPADDPAVTEVPRDETQDSVDQTTGTLTDDAVAKRAQLAADQAKREADAAAADVADKALSEAQANDKAAHDLLDQDDAAVSADEAALADLAKVEREETVLQGPGVDTTVSGAAGSPGAVSAG